MTTEFSLNAVRFEDVRTGIVNFLKENGTFKAEFDFNGSNIGYMIDIAAYETMLLSYQSTLEANNIFLDTTEIRKNAVSIAKRIGYRPKRKISSQFTGTMEYFAGQDETFVQGDQVIIPARTDFDTAPGNIRFINLLPITLTFENSVLLSGEFILVEGIFKQVQTFGTGQALQEIVVDSEDVEEDNISLFIRTTNTASSANKQWTEVPSFFTTTNNEIFFVEEDIVNEKRPKIVFGDGILGKIPLNTETITIEYLQTQGDIANDEISVSFTNVNGPGGVTTNSVSGFTYTFSNLSINLPELQTSSGGKDNETLVEIQFNAPRFFSAAGRAVNLTDFLTQLEIFSATLLYFNVIGGNVLFPEDALIEKGIIYIVGVPTGIDEDDFLNNNTIYLTELQENVIIPQLEDPTVLSTIKRFVKPTYIFLQMSPFIEVPSSFSIDEKQTSIADVSTNIDTFIVENIRGLEKGFRHSQVLSEMVTSVGVIAAELDVVHNFIINDESFYGNRTSRMNLPILFSKDSNGNIITDTNNIPILTNFIKKRSEIIDDTNKERVVGAAESSIVTTTADVAGNLGGTYFTLSEITVLGNEVQYYVWFDVGSGSADPAPAGFTNRVKVNIESGDSETVVAAALAAALAAANAQNSWATSVNAADVTITNKEIGFVENNVADGTAGFIFLILTRGLDTDFFDQFTLPIDLSSIFGNLTHPNSDRKLFNIDITSVSFIEFVEVGTVGNEVVNFNTFPFKDQNDITYIPNLVETVTDTWSVQLNGRNIATLKRTGTSVFAISGVDEFFLKDTVGIVPATGESVILNVDKITETDQDNITTTFFSINFLLNNNIFTDVRLFGKNLIANATFDAKNFTWTYTNTATFANVEIGRPIVTLTPIDAQAINESVLQVNHDVDTTNIILSMRNFNGALTLQNFNLESLVRYDFRNDFELQTDFTLTQEPSQTIYEVSKQFTADSGSVQIIDLLAKETTRMKTVSNPSNAIDGTFFNIFSAKDATEYYVWFDSASGADNDPTPIGTATGVKVSIGNNDSAATVATTLINVMNTFSATDFSAILNSGDTDVVNISNLLNGKSTDASQPTSLISAGIAFDSVGDSFVNQTTAVNDSFTNDITLLPSVGATVNDAFYFSKDHKFNTITVTVGIVGDGSWVVTPQYWSGSGWTNLNDVVDNTADATDNSYTVVGTNTISWTFPGDWASTTLDDAVSGAPTGLGTLYWMRMIVTTGDTSGISAPVGTQVTVSGSPVFTPFSVTTQGAENLKVDLDKLKADDLLTVTGSGNSNNDGTFIIKSVDSTTGIIEIYNNNGISDTTGTASATHFEVTKGSYGEFTIFGFDLYHDISIGKLRYDTGELEFQLTVKGFTDKANSKVIEKTIRSIFDNYTATSKMDFVKIFPIDNFSNTGVFLGQQIDFDPVFNQSIQTDVSNPTIKT